MREGRLGDLIERLQRGFVADWVRRVLEIDGINRAIVIGAQGFGAFFPFLIIYGSIVGDSSAVSDDLVDRFDLEGSAAATLRSLFGSANEEPSDATVIGVVLLSISALAFARALQRLYESSWRVERLGVRASGFGLIWLAALIAYLSLLPVISGLTGIPGWDLTVSLSAGGALWLATPYLLLARRVNPRRLLPSALLTVVSMTVVGACSALYMPALVESYGEEFGTIGVAFALLSWLTAGAMTLMATATLGAVVTERFLD